MYDANRPLQIVFLHNIGQRHDVAMQTTYVEHSVVAIPNQLTVAGLVMMIQSLNGNLRYRSFVGLSVRHAGEHQAVQ